MTNYLPPKTPAQNAKSVSTSIQREGKLFVQVWDGDEKIEVNTDGSINIVLKVVDEEGNNVPIGVVGAAQNELRVGDEDTRDLLTSLIEEMKIMNTHLSLITDTSIDREETEV